MIKQLLTKTVAITLSFMLMSGTAAMASSPGVLTGDRVNVRSGPSTSTSILTQFNTGQKVTVLSKEGDWYKIAYGINQTAYIYAQFLKVTETVPTVTPVASATKKDGNAVVAYAKQFLGRPYVYGGNSLYSGTDCSGFTKLIYANFGYSLPRTSSSQMSSGKAIAVSSLQAGDLVFYGYSGRITHVAIYMGSNQIIHESTPSTGVVIGGLYDRGNGNFMGCRRIL